MLVQVPDEWRLEIFDYFSFQDVLKILNFLFFPADNIGQKLKLMTHLGNNFYFTPFKKASLVSEFDVSFWQIHHEFHSFNKAPIF